MSFTNKLDKLIDRYEFLKNSLTSSLDPKEFAKLSKEFSDLEEIVETIIEFKKLNSQLSDVIELLSDADLDEEFKQIALEDKLILSESIKSTEEKIKILLLPKDIDDEKNAILEVRAGAGGDEAGLFAADLFRMYQRYSAEKSWKFEVLSMSESGIGSIKEASAVISGKGVFSKLKFESGVHRVQRVPQTEASGRIHTSTATVAVLPEAEEVDIKIDDKDLAIDVYRASGAGGQHVNTTDSAVRITHIPTGIVVTQQDERSQHKNKAKALKILRAKLYEADKIKKESQRAAERKEQVGTADRSERIRTYNFPQGRVSDHRINLTLYKILPIINGEALDDLIDPLHAHYMAEKLANSIEGA